MTGAELCRRCGVPPSTLRKYEKLRPCADGGCGDYDESDARRIGTFMTLCEAGFSPEEAMLFLCCGDESGDGKLKMLRDKRGALLDNIHDMERLLSKLDYLAFEITKNK